MKVTPLLKYGLFALILFVLWLAYGFFYEQSLINSGDSRSERVVQSIQEGDSTGVITDLQEFAGGEEFAKNDPAYQKAIIDISFIEALLDTDDSYSFVRSEVSNESDDLLYSGVYSISAEQGGEDYIIVVLKRDGDTWVLANVYLAAINPLEDEAESS